ncbi:MAG: S26 family signal peptidase, partial [Candidatus Obscuribacterales bacterium]|nr:S26 family signal peptidase [Candidatus Obscuribacterales bacterium]
MDKNELDTEAPPANLEQVPSLPDSSRNDASTAKLLPAPSIDAASAGSAKSGAAKSKGFLRESLEMIAMTLALLIFIRTALAEARYIPSGSMEPSLQINDRVLVEKVSAWTMRPIERGDILVFYPPAIELGGQDISYEPLHFLGRLTGLPFLPIDTAYI